MITMPHQEVQILREVHLMTAAGWRLHRREPNGAVFVSGGSGSGISAGVHLILLVLTLGLWLPFLVIVELASSGGSRYCRLTFAPDGHPVYETIKKPGRAPSYVDRPASHAVAHAEGMPCRCQELR